MIVGVRHVGRMTEIVHKYREVHAECCQLLDAAFGLSSATQGRAVATRGISSPGPTAKADRDDTIPSTVSFFPDLGRVSINVGVVGF